LTIVDEALLRIAALYKVEDAIRSSSPDHRRTVRQDLSRPLVDAFFGCLTAQAVEPYACLVDLFTRLADGHLDKAIDTLMPRGLHPNSKSRDCLKSGEMTSRGIPQ